MNKLIISISAAVILSLTASSVLASQALRPMTLVVMYDGLRADAFENADMSCVRSLRDGKWHPDYKCAWTLNANTILDTHAVSAPNHVSIATGVTAAKHKVFNNGKNSCDYNKWPSFLARIVTAQPEKKALFMFSWGWDNGLSRHKGVEFVHNKDEKNAEEIVKRLSSPSAPDATLWYINDPDHGGHVFGFYPYTIGYFKYIRQYDRAVGAALKAIVERPTFAKEDWLIVITADHGGYWRGHGMMFGHSTTVPLFVSGRKVAQGRMPGARYNYDVAPTVLKHFGIDSSKMNLDGTVVGDKVEEENPRKLSSGLAVYLPFDGKAVRNAVPTGPKPFVCGSKTSIKSSYGFIDGGLKVSADKNAVGGIYLKGSEKLAFENNSDFAMTMWIRMTDKQVGDPVIVSNKDWKRGVNSGFALIAAKQFNSRWVKSTPGVSVNVGANGKKRKDLGPYDVAYNAWNFYAVTKDKHGLLRFYQGRDDGYLYMISEDFTGLKFITGLPFYIGQDGTGRYNSCFNGYVDDFALWTRTLSHDDIRRIFESGRKGCELSELLREEK